MRHPAVTSPHPGHQHTSATQDGRCCQFWPPASQVRTVGSILTTSQLRHTATYTVRLLAALTALAAVHTLLLPALTAFAAAHGVVGWTVFTIWAAGSLAALHRGVLTRHRSRTAVHALHAATITAVLMAIAAPGGWAQTLTATAGAAIAWLTAIRATHR